MRFRSVIREWIVPFAQPTLFAVIPPVSLLAANLGELTGIELLRPLLASLALAFFSFLMSWLILRDRARAGIASALATVLLLSYGHLYDGLKTLGIPGETLVRHRFLAPVLIGLGLVGVWLIARLKRSGEGGLVIVVVGLSALVLPVSSIVQYSVEAQQLSPSSTTANVQCDLDLAPGDQAPDIYIVIMDAYERSDVLRAVHGFDNSSFLDQLRDLGFYVADGAMSNYRFTVLSLSTMLNMDYVQAYPELYDPNGRNWWPFAQMIRDNRVRRELACLGYTTVAIDSGVFWTNWEDADYYLARTAGPLRGVGTLGGVSRAESIFLDTTFARVALDAVRQTGGLGLPGGLDPDSMHRETVLYAFDQLSRLPSLPSPKLVYVHILSPHPPMVFGQEAGTRGIGDFDAEFSSDDQTALRAYGDQVAYLNARLLEAMQAILQSSPNPPVILLTADHGWAERDAEDKHSILHAYFLPDNGALALYPTITPVNSFRLIFDLYFGTSLGLLPDQSYYSTLDDRFNFRLVENSWLGSGDS